MPPKPKPRTMIKKATMKAAKCSCGFLHGRLLVRLDMRRTEKDAVLGLGGG